MPYRSNYIAVLFTDKNQTLKKYSKCLQMKQGTNFSTLLVDVSARKISPLPYIFKTIEKSSSISKMLR